ncbi:UNVERIFIED_CONTAM: hypothetical protein RMT77_011977 [Armadillidium vulgare]
MSKNYFLKNRNLPIIIQNLSPKLHPTEVQRDEGSKCIVPAFDNLDNFYNYVTTPTTNCTSLEEFGGKGKKPYKDGTKYVCLDESFKLASNNCVVLSFGISNDWSFDEAMDKYGCTVYAFDPTIGEEDFDKTPKIHFFNLGLSDNQGKKIIKEKTCKVDRYENIVKRLNLSTTIIDYLKIDIEGSEREFFNDIFDTSPQLLKYIKQISMEIHPRSPFGLGFPKIERVFRRTLMFYDLWEGMKKLECEGFKIVHTEMNRFESSHFRYKNQIQARFYEIVWLNTNFRYQS